MENQSAYACALVNSEKRSVSFTSCAGYDLNTPEDIMTTPDTSAKSNRLVRNSEKAKLAAQERVETARRVEEAVSAYHNAADRMESAQSELSGASRERLLAIKTLRDCKLSITEIGELTGLSSSRVQTLSKTS